MKSNTYVQIFCFFMCCNALTLVAQSNQIVQNRPSDLQTPSTKFLHKRWEGGPLFTLAQYQGDLSNGTTKELNSGYGILLRRHLNDNIALRGTFFKAALSGNDKNISRLANRGFSFSSPVTEMNVLAEYDFLGKRRYRNQFFHKIISPYVALGAGLAFINPTTNYNEANNNALMPRIEEDKKATSKQTLLSLNYGLGLKIDVNNGWAINLDFSKRLLFNDKVDGVKIAGNPNRGDSFCFNSVGLIYRFRQKNDKDRDGIVDALDFCPTQYGSKNFNGCPDQDGDLIPDKDDLCPTEAGEKAFSGCLAAKPAYEIELIRNKKLKK